MDRILRIGSEGAGCTVWPLFPLQCKFTEKFSTASYNLEKNFSNLGRGDIPVPAIYRFAPLPNNSECDPRRRRSISPV